MLDDEMYQAIGEVAVAAAQLEYQVAYLIAVARNEDDEALRQMLGKVGEVRTQLNKLCDALVQVPFRSDLLRLRRDFKAVMDDRHILLHSVSMIDQGDEGKTFWSFWHPKSDTEVRIDAPAIKEHAFDLSRLGAKALKLASEAHAWRTSGQ